MKRNVIIAVIDGKKRNLLIGWDFFSSMILTHTYQPTVTCRLDTSSILLRCTSTAQILPTP
jgi:hypothetical protein